jgi:hypothetical protein
MNQASPQLAKIFDRLNAEELLFVGPHQVRLKLARGRKDKFIDLIDNRASLQPALHLPVEP